MAHQRCWKTGQELAIGFFHTGDQSTPALRRRPHSPACATLRRANGGDLCLSSFDRAATVEVWIPDWNRLAGELAKIGFIAIDPGSTGQTRQIGSVTSRKLPASPVFLHIPGGYVGMRAALLRDMASLPACTLFLPTANLLSADVSKMAEARDIHVETIAERMAMPSSERGTLLVRARSAAKKTSPKKELHPILDVQPGWTWENLRMVLDPTGSISSPPSDPAACPLRKPPPNWE